MADGVHRNRLAVWGIVVVALVAAALIVLGQPDDGSAQETSQIAAPPLDPEVILPARVDAALGRSLSALDRSEARVDDRQYGTAAVSLSALAADLNRSHRAAWAQFRAPVDPESESTAGPDSVMAMLAVEQSAITRLAGLYDTVTDPAVLNRLGGAMNVALAKRDVLVNAVIKLDPEGAGAAYADGMADSVDGYTDEVGCLTEALKVDRLTTSARAALNNALTRSKATAAKVLAAYGGGD
jgi:hypothetical protein